MPSHDELAMIPAATSRGVAGTLQKVMMSPISLTLSHAAFLSLSLSLSLARSVCLPVCLSHTQTRTHILFRARTRLLSPTRCKASHSCTRPLPSCDGTVRPMEETGPSIRCLSVYVCPSVRLSVYLPACLSVTNIDIAMTGVVTVERY